jgi:hypothetical protein
MAIQLVESTGNRANERAEVAWRNQPLQEEELRFGETISRFYQQHLYFEPQHRDWRLIIQFEPEASGRIPSFWSTQFDSAEESRGEVRLYIHKWGRKRGKKGQDEGLDLMARIRRVFEEAMNKKIAKASADNQLALRFRKVSVLECSQLWGTVNFNNDDALDRRSSVASSAGSAGSDASMVDSEEKMSEAGHPNTLVK